MKKLALIAGLLVLTAGVFAQGSPRVGWYNWGCYNWDSSKVVIVKGELVSVAPGQMKFRDQDKNRMYFLHLGPYWYLSKIGLKIAQGNTLKVKGLLIENSTGSHLCAAEVTAEGKVYKLRDENGKPMWWNYRGRGYRYNQNKYSGCGMRRGRWGGAGRW